MIYYTIGFTVTLIILYLTDFTEARATSKEDPSYTPMYLLNWLIAAIWPFSMAFILVACIGMLIHKYLLVIIEKLFTQK